MPTKYIQQFELFTNEDGRKRKKIICPVCGESVVRHLSSKQIFCSYKCARVLNWVPRVPRETHNCPVCGIGFGPTRITSPKKYCSIKCFVTTRTPRFPREIRSCIICGKEFECMTKTSQKYCSTKCAGITRRLPRETKHCLQCGAEMIVITGSIRTFCSYKCKYTYPMPEEQRRRLSNGHKNREPLAKLITRMTKSAAKVNAWVKLTPEQKLARGRLLKDGWAKRTPEERAAFCQKRRDVHSKRTLEEKKKIGQIISAAWNNLSPEDKKIRCQKVKDGLANQTPEEKAKRVQNWKKQWNSLTPKEKAERLRKTKLVYNKNYQTRPERIFNAFCKKNKYPFKFVGNTYLSQFSGKRPDFIYPGTNKVIETAGGHYHLPEYEVKRVAFFTSLGYDCLVIWSSELKDLEKVKTKVEEFMEN